MAAFIAWVKQRWREPKKTPPAAKADLVKDGEILIPHTTEDREEPGTSASTSTVAPPPIFNLPLEVLQLIAEPLRPSEAIAFVLCNKRALSVVPSRTGLLPSRVWKECRSDIVERQHFLSLLDKDMHEGYIHCWRCAKIHVQPYPIESTDTNGFLSFRSCHKEDKTAGYEELLGGSYRTLALQVIMKRHRPGLDTSQYLLFLRQRRVRRCRGTTPQAVARVSEPKIISGEFFVRSQFWMLCSSPNSHFRLHDWATGSECCDFGICRHINFGWNNKPVEQMKAIYNSWETTLVSDKKGILRSNGPRLRYCKYCHTEYQLDITAIGKGMAMAMVITKWENWGEAVTPFDPKWMRHLCTDKCRPAVIEGSPEKYWIDQYPDRQTVKREAGSIKTAYEGSHEFDFQSPLGSEGKEALWHEAQLDVPLI